MKKRNTNKDKQSDNSDLGKRTKAPAFKTHVISAVSKKNGINIYLHDFRVFVSLIKSKILK